MAGRSCKSLTMTRPKSDCCQDSVELLRLVVLQRSPKNAVPLCKCNIYIKPDAKESDMSHCISSLDLAPTIQHTRSYQSVIQYRVPPNITRLPSRCERKHVPQVLNLILNSSDALQRCWSHDVRLQDLPATRLSASNVLEGQIWNSIRHLVGNTPALTALVKLEAWQNATAGHRV